MLEFNSQKGKQLVFFLGTQHDSENFVLHFRCQETKDFHRIFSSNFLIEPFQKINDQGEVDVNFDDVMEYLSTLNVNHMCPTDSWTNVTQIRSSSRLSSSKNTHSIERDEILHEEMNAIKSQLRDEQEKNSATSKIINSLNAEIKTLVHNMTASHESNARFQNTIKLNLSKNEALKKRCEKLKIANDLNEALTSELETKCESLSTENSQLSSKNSKLSATNSKLSATNSQLKKKCDDLKTIIDGLKAEQLSATDDVNNFESTIAKLTKELNDVKTVALDRKNKAAEVYGQQLFVLKNESACQNTEIIRLTENQRKLTSDNLTTLDALREIFLIELAKTKNEIDTEWENKLLEATTEVTKQAVITQSKAVEVIVKELTFKASESTKTIAELQLAKDHAVESESKAANEVKKLQEKALELTNNITQLQLAKDHAVESELKAANEVKQLQEKALELTNGIEELQLANRQVVDLNRELSNCRECTSQQQENNKLTLEIQNLEFKVKFLEECNKNQREDFKYSQEQTTKLVNICRPPNAYMQSQPYAQNYPSHQNYPSQNFYDAIPPETYSSDNSTEKSAEATSNSMSYSHPRPQSVSSNHVPNYQSQGYHPPAMNHNYQYQTPNGRR